MSLLARLMTHPLEPGYATAASRRAHGHRLGATSRAVTALAAVLCGLSAVVAVNHLRRPAPEAVQARRLVEAELTERIAHVEGTRTSNDTTRRRIAELQDQALTGAGGRALADEVAGLGRLTGELAVTGPGLQVVLEDAPVPAGGQPDADSVPARRGRVTDRDLQLVVNGLWAAGAEAIAINGSRLTSLSAIRSAGQAILVDLQPQLPPYEIAALGEPDRLRTHLAEGIAGRYLDLLTADGIRSRISPRARVDLPGSASTFRLHHARPVREVP
ncbi:MAG: DUF881 domain-containing protein [Kineosporiaceae bacterium]|nr:DUF881 domain-containing protein [Kineosporiaceae bacterium]